MHLWKTREEKLEEQEDEAEEEMKEFDVPPRMKDAWGRMRKKKEKDTPKELLRCDGPPIDPG